MRSEDIKATLRLSTPVRTRPVKSWKQRKYLIEAFSIFYKCRHVAGSVLLYTPFCFAVPNLGEANKYR
jgi:hypothetical protein